MTFVANRSVPGKIYSNWFAVALYDLYNITLSRPTIEDQTEFSFLDTHMQIVGVHQIVKSVQVLSRLSDDTFNTADCHSGIMHKQKLRTSEVTQTALLARALDRFLFPDDEVEAGACVHQLPVHGTVSTPECADFYVLKLEGALPNRPIAIADYKKTNSDAAARESFGYATRLIENSTEEWEFAARLVFPWTCENIKLQLHVGMKTLMMIIDIVSVPIHATSPQLHRFFCTLYAAVHYLLQHRTITRLDAPCISPTPSLHLHDCLSPDQCSLPARVFKQGTWIYKLFDREVKLPLWQLSLPEAQVQALGASKHFWYLQYKYRAGSHTPQAKRQFVPLLRILRCLHQEHTCVHSDIRKENLIFSSDGQNAWILDFDLADRIATTYPTNYNHVNITERHPTATAELERQPVHDYYSLSVIMGEHSARLGIAQNVLTLVSDGRVDECLPYLASEV